MTVGVVDTAEVVVAAAVEGTAAVAVAEAGAETSDPGIGTAPAAATTASPLVMSATVARLPSRAEVVVVAAATVVAVAAATVVAVAAATVVAVVVAMAVEGAEEEVAEEAGMVTGPAQAATTTATLSAPSATVARPPSREEGKAGVVEAGAGDTVEAGVAAGMTEAGEAEVAVVVAAAAAGMATGPARAAATSASPSAPSATAARLPSRLVGAAVAAVFVPEVETKETGLLGTAEDIAAVVATMEAAANREATMMPPLPRQRPLVTVTIPPLSAESTRPNGNPAAACRGKECGEDCDNNRIYVSGLPTTITETDLVEKFGGIGIIARIRQKRGYKDQWPFSVRIYKDDSTGKPKGDCIIKYEEPTSAHAALKWFDGVDFKGGKIGVAMAAKPSLNNRY
eukprot:jgi/Undpi1/10892/HiC_scaffold_3.g01418.m1